MGAPTPLTSMDTIVDCSEEYMEGREHEGTR
jgi:hypothetical protein